MVGTTISDKTDFNINIATRDNGHFVMIKQPKSQEDGTLINIFASNNRAMKYKKQKLTELREIDISIIVGNVRTPLSTDRRSTENRIFKQHYQSTIPSTHL